ncbi:hypothetical protein B296_00049369 [Ensete ventricosum]|uniref:Uncharacterized protein n=1 Tax=Ensete ventricosum TaxID=4639 RepID=A0A426YJB5_ENSVE|nr:hypothetical protein B296_00049369 [Ensete ventricosum]
MRCGRSGSGAGYSSEAGARVSDGAKRSRSILWLAVKVLRREKEEEGEEEESLEISSPDSSRASSPADDFFSPRGEKKRLPA